MIEKIMTYREEFPAGTQVVIKAGPGEGADHEFDGKIGTIVDRHGAIAVEVDRLPLFWKNPVLISPHNLCAIQARSDMTKEQIDAIPRVEATALLARIPAGRGYEDRVLVAVECAMNQEWWRGWHAAKLALGQSAE